MVIRSLKRQPTSTTPLSSRTLPRYPIPNSCSAASPPVLVALPEERVACCPLEADVAAAEVNSPDPAAVDPPAELVPPLEAARALGVPREDDEEVVDDELRAKACSGPNSRLASAAGVNVTGLFDAAPAGRPAPGAASR